MSYGWIVDRLGNVKLYSVVKPRIVINFIAERRWNSSHKQFSENHFWFFSSPAPSPPPHRLIVNEMKSDFFPSIKAYQVKFQIQFGTNFNEARKFLGAHVFLHIGKNFFFFSRHRFYSPESHSLWRMLDEPSLHTFLCSGGLWDLKQNEL